MSQLNIKYVNDDLGNPMSVIVPIELWHEIEADRLLKKRLIDTKIQSSNSGADKFWRKHVKNLEIEPASLDDLAWWIKEDKKVALRIIRLIRDVYRHPFTGIGNPKLVSELYSIWSRDIDDVHQLYYQVFNEKIRINTFRYEYY